MTILKETTHWPKHERVTAVLTLPPLLCFLVYHSPKFLPNLFGLVNTWHTTGTGNTKNIILQLFCVNWLGWYEMHIFSHFMDQPIPLSPSAPRRTPWWAAPLKRTQRPESFRQWDFGFSADFTAFCARRRAGSCRNPTRWEGRGPEPSLSFGPLPIWYR